MEWVLLKCTVCLKFISLVMYCLKSRSEGRLFSYSRSRHILSLNLGWSCPHTTGLCGGFQADMLAEKAELGQAVVAYAWDHSTQEAEAEGSLSLRRSW